MELLVFGDVQSNLVRSALMLGCGAFFGGAVYLLMVYPSLRRRVYRTPLGFSKRSGAIVGSAILLAFGVGAYFSYLSSFFDVTLDQSQARLNYRFPPSTVTLAREEIQRLGHRVASTKGGRRISLVVVARNGRVYESAELKTEPFIIAYDHFEKWLANRK